MITVTLHQLMQGQYLALATEEDRKYLIPKDHKEFYESLEDMIKFYKTSEPWLYKVLWLINKSIFDVKQDSTGWMINIKSPLLVYRNAGYPLCKLLVDTYDFISKVENLLRVVEPVSVSNIQMIQKAEKEIEKALKKDNWLKE